MFLIVVSLNDCVKKKLFLLITVVTQFHIIASLWYNDGFGAGAESHSETPSAK